jgi:hypothetical protein|tara:strand:- start:772 stop:1068 length:297 start_codon:yes stop_codon:yes gene_type:complete
LNIGEDMSIKVLRLVTSEELIGKWNPEKCSIHNPVVMVPVSKDKIGFQPWITLGEDEEIFLKDQHIMTIVTPDIKLQNEYNRVFGSGIIIPGDEGIIG